MLRFNLHKSKMAYDDDGDDDIRIIIFYADLVFFSFFFQQPTPNLNLCLEKQKITEEYYLVEKN